MIFYFDPLACSCIISLLESCNVDNVYVIYSSVECKGDIHGESWEVTNCYVVVDIACQRI